MQIMEDNTIKSYPQNNASFLVIWHQVWASKDDRLILKWANFCL